MLNHQKATVILFVTLLPLLFLAFITQSLAESAEQQELPGLETVGGIALTTQVTTNGQVGVSSLEAVFEVSDLRSTDILLDTDLAISKSDSPDPVTAGKTLTYTLIVNNVGPVGASNVVITDTLPSEVTLLETGTSQGTGCNENANPVICDLGPLTAASSATVTITVNVDPGVTGTITNQAQVGSAADNNPSNDSTTENTTVNAVADLGITKGDNPDPVLAGLNLTYVLTVTNSGPSDASNVVVTDTLPAGVTLLSTSVSQGLGCNETANPVICNLGTLSASGSATATLFVKVNENTEGNINNLAQVGSDAGDDNGANNNTSETTSVVADADVAISKLDEPDPVAIGQNLIYTLTVTNNGPSEASKVIVTDTLPNGVTLLSTSASQGPGCNEAATPLFCDLKGIGALQSATIIIEVNVVTNTLGTLVNSAQVGAKTADRNPGNNKASENTTVVAEADLAIIKTDGPDPVTAGQNLTYTLMVNNNGPSAAGNVIVTDTLPSGVTLLSTSTSQGSGCNEATNPVICDLGALAASSSAAITMTVGVDSDTTGTIKNQARVGSDATDNNPANDTISADTTVNAVADLAITKTDDSDPVTAGQNLAYTLIVSNAGPSAAVNVVVTDTLPAGVQLISVTPSQGGPCIIGQTLSCALGTVGPAGTATIAIVVKVDSGQTGNLLNKAGVRSDNADPDLVNNSAMENTSLVTSADLALAKAARPNPVVAGKNLTYTLSITNNGPSVATGVLATDTLPSQGQVASVIPSQGSGCTGTGALVCDLGTLTVGQSARITIVVSLDASLAPMTINNLALTSSDVADPKPANNSDTTATSVVSITNLEIKKTADPDPVAAGDQLTYVLAVTNDGPSNATGVVVTDNLPSEVNIDSVSSSQGNPCDEAGPVVCNLGLLTVGAGAKITIAVAVDAGAAGTIQNTAEVAGEQTDPDSEDNLAVRITSVDQIGALPVVKLDDPDPVIAGNDLSYTLHVSSTGPSNAKSVNLVDTLPSEVNFITATTTLGTCNHLTGTVTCDLGDMLVGTEATVGILVNVDSTILGQINNSAILSAQGVDPSLVNQNSTVIGSADLEVKNVSQPNPVVAGQSMTYTIDVTNSGPSLAENVVVNNPLPLGVIFNSSPDCALVASTIICNFGDIGSGESISTTILVDVDSTTLGLIYSVASVLSDTPDPRPANNSDVAAASAVAVADLGIVKSGNAIEVVAGTNLTYTLTINNNGPSDATFVEVVDTLPGGLNLLTTSTSQGSGCNEATNPVVCSLGTLTASSSATITMVVSVDPEALGVIQNQAEVDSNTPDNNPANDSVTEDTTLIAEANLAISKTDAPNPVTAGENLIFTLAITNTGPSAATSIVVTDNLPSGVQLISVTPSQGGPCTGSQTLTCTLGTLGLNDSATINVVVKVNPAQLAPLLNTASVGSNAADLDLSNNEDSTSTTVVRSADLTIDITDQPDPVIAGELLTYTLTINNKGPSDATGVVVTNILPGEVTLTDASTSIGGGCSGASPVVCNLGVLGADSIATVTLLVTVDPSIEVTMINTATVTSQVEDPLPSNNSKTESTTVLEKIFVFYIPVSVKGPTSDEPNDKCQQAIRISPNVNYAFFPDDKFDWYHFDTSFDGTMTAVLSNFKPRFGQIALYRGNSCDSRVLLGNNGTPSETKTINAGFQTTGHFYVFVSNDGILTNKDLYNLVINVTQ